MLLAGIGWSLLAANGLAQTIERPNVVIILADDLGYGDLSCYGGWIETPRLDALAKQGLKFTDFHSNGVVCSPTRAALLTGRYPQRAGIPGVILADPAGATHDDGLADQEWTLAEALRESGYATGLVGKWHLGYRPQFNPIHHGFDSFRGYVSGNVDYFSHIDQAGAEDWWHNDQLQPEDGYSTHLITQHAVEFIQAHTAEPFFLLVAHEAPHYPFQGPEDQPLRQADRPGAIQGERVDKSAAYREMVHELDRGVGQIIDTLQELEIEKRTLVWFMSDNGAAAQGSNRPWKGRKGTVWEGGHRVPAIAWWPGQILPGTESADLGMTCDVMPTLLELAQVPARDAVRFDGESLKSLWDRESGADPEPTALQPRTLFWNGRAVRQGRWKLVLEGQGLARRPLLFDLATDPTESTNVAGENPQIARELVVALDAWQEEMQRTKRPQPSHSD